MELKIGKERDRGEVGFLQMGAIFFVGFGIRDGADWIFRTALDMGSTLAWILSYLVWGLVVFGGYFLVSRYNVQRAARRRTAAAALPPDPKPSSSPPPGSPPGP